MPRKPRAHQPLAEREHGNGPENPAAVPSFHSGPGNALNVLWRDTVSGIHVRQWQTLAGKPSYGRIAFLTGHCTSSHIKKSFRFPLGPGRFSTLS